MENEKIEMATISSRWRVCIPNDIGEEMGLKEGTKILFLLSGDSLIVKKVSMQSWAEVTKPLKEAAKKSGLKEEDVGDLVHRIKSQKQTKMKIVADTDVLISSTFWYGASDRIIEKAENREFELLISTDIINEFVKTFNS